MHCMHVLVDGFVSGGVKGAAARHVQIFAARSVDVMRKIQNAFAVLGRLKENGSGAITEQDARGTILVVQNRTHYIASDHDHFSLRTGADELRSNSKGVCKTQAVRGQI